MGVASTLLKQVRLTAGLSSRALAQRAGTAQARVSEIERAVHDPAVGTLDKSIRAAGWQLIALPTRAPTAAAVALSIREHQPERRTKRSEERSFRSLLVLSDGLDGAEPALRVALCVAPPPPTGDPRYDAAIAGLVEHHLSKDSLPVPDWVHEPDRTLTEPWTPDPHAEPAIHARVPSSLRRHGVLLAASELESV